MRMHARWLVTAAQAALTAGALALIRSGRVPLGVRVGGRSEWEWLRISARVEPALVVIAIGVAGAYVAFASLAARSVARGRRAWPWLVGLVPMAVAVQLGLQAGAPPGYGLEKWAIALVQPGSSGYYTVAKEIRDLPAFLAAYPEWIKTQDALHIGTHPPGLFATSWGVLRWMERHPDAARAVVSALPQTFHVAFSTYRPLPVADRAALAVTGFAILALCASTCVPLYVLSRRWLSPTASWAAACLWPLVPSALMFQPAADAAFPLLATAALAMAAWSGAGWGWAVLAGVVLGIGTQFTLAFFPMGLVVGIVQVVGAKARTTDPPEPASPPGVGRELGWRRGLISLAATGLGFLAVTFSVWAVAGANPFRVWTANAANHSRFYAEYPRSYVAWVVENPIELAVGLGLPAVVWAMAGVRRAPVVSWATALTLAFLTLSGKNLSEVARLWLPLMPPLMVMAGAGAERVKPGAGGLAATLGLMAVQTLVLQATIQVVYPVS